MKFAYIEKSFNYSTKPIIEQAITIIEEYSAAGYSLTLRQLYYQFVSRDWLPNNQKSYDRLGSIINNARLAGLIDWNAIEDRTRNLRTVAHWDSPAEIMEAVVQSYKRDLWASQAYRPEVWIEKDALIGVVEPLCNKLRIPCFSCRGYVSQSEMWVAGQRFVQHYHNCQVPLVLHLGDHDPSGIDMTRDIHDRLQMFVNGHLSAILGKDIPVGVKRLALNYEQVEAYNPPPNPAKQTDSRCDSYVEKFGESSWELDALPPDVLCGLIANAVAELRDEKAWNKALMKENKEKEELEQVRRDFLE